MKNKINIGLLIAASALPNLQSDPTKLERIYLANVALYLNDEEDFRNLLLVSTNGQEALKMLKKNPTPLTQSNRPIFPNIETQALFSENDEIFTGGKIKKYKHEHIVDYNFYVQHKNENTKFSRVLFTYTNLEDPLTLERFEVPEGVTHLDIGCFAGLTNLRHITIPSSVTHIKSCCFSNFRNLQHITISNNIKYLGVRCFLDCDQLQNIDIVYCETGDTDRCTQMLIGNLIQSGLDLSKINITMYQYSHQRQFLPYIETTFADGQTKRIYTHPVSYSFYSTNENQGYIFKDIFFTQKDQQDHANQLTNNSVYTIPDGVTYLGYWCFSCCDNLQTITIPDSVNYLGNNCFTGCTRLQTITIPDSVNYLGNWCFEGCRELRRIIIIATGNGDAEFVKNMITQNLTNSGLDPNSIVIEIQ